jgi:hypothetical protein
VAMAGRMSRARAEGLLGEKLTSPIEAIRSAPLITAEGGGVLAIGAHRLSGEVAVTLASSWVGCGFEPRKWCPYPRSRSKAPDFGWHLPSLILRDCKLTDVGQCLWTLVPNRGHLPPL